MKRVVLTAIIIGCGAEPRPSHTTLDASVNTDAGTRPDVFERNARTDSNFPDTSQVWWDLQPRPDQAISPDATHPDSARPDAHRQDAHQPDLRRVRRDQGIRVDRYVYRHDAGAPDTYHRPDAFRPDRYRPDARRPDAYRHDAYQPDAKPIPLHQRWITIRFGSRRFQIMATEMTNERFEALVYYRSQCPFYHHADPTYHCGVGKNCPVCNVSWGESARACNNLNSSEKDRCYVCGSSYRGWDCREKKEYKDDITKCKGYRLPTKAEWQYAYRAGTTTPLYNGPATYPYARRIGWYSANSNSGTRYSPWPVGKLQPNTWGLYDMAGNVMEWVNDTDTRRVTERVRMNCGYDCSRESGLVWSRYSSSSSMSKHATFGFRCARSL